MAYVLDAEKAQIKRFVVSGQVSLAERQAIVDDMVRLLTEDRRVAIIVDYRAATLNASPEDALEFAKSLDVLATHLPIFGLYVVPGEPDRSSVDVSVTAAGALGNVPINVCAELSEAYKKIAQRMQADA